MLAALAVLGLGVSPALGQGAVSHVVVVVTFEGDAPHPIIRNRLETTVLSVADRLLTGLPVDQVATLQPRPEETIANVVDRVAIGYAVVDAAVQAGATSTVTIRLRSVGAVIRAVAVAVDLKTVHARVQPVILALLQPGPVGMAQSFLVGLPVAAWDWAGPLVTQELKEIVEAAVPGFTAGYRLRPAERSILDLTIVPKDSRVVRNIGVRFRSESIPLLLLDQHAPQVASMADPLRGLPVAFVDAERTAMEHVLNEDLATYAPAVEYRVMAAARLDVAETLYLYVGPQAPGPAVVARLGRLVSPQLEPFVELRLVPTPLALTGAVGVRIEVSPAAFVAVTYAPTPRETTFWTTVQFSRDVGVRGNWTFPTQVFEGAATFRINEFLAWEFIGNSAGQAWVRLVSNL
ncbi:MAG: hypothetical protein AUH31_01420 [Armatimonadetes bacterium 13_1_40CM_64_14]|nr:MAG: hypothetical protein AUH31_01420 [Armatimonadetes bacterium 13_1_40CM_64_14]